MKRIIILCALFIVGCRSQGDWDSGSNKSQAFEQQRQEERVENTNNQLPGSARPFQHQPF